MVSELAGEGAMSPQLSKPASHAELQVRLRRKIRRGSVLRSGVTKSNQDFLHAISLFSLLSLQINEDRSAVLVFQSSLSRSKVLISFSFAVFNRSRSVKNSSRVLDRVDAMFAVFDRDSWRRSNESLSAVLVPPCVVISVHMTAPGYGKGSIAKVFSREVFDRVIEEEFSENDQHKDSEKSNFNGSNGGEELQASLMAIPIQNSAMVSRPQIFGVIVSAIGSLSAKLVVAVLSPQRRTRKKKPLLTPIREFASEKSQGKRRVSDLKNRVGKLRSEIKAATAINEEAKQIKVSEFREWKVKRSKDASELNDNDVVSFNSALESAAESKLVENIAFGEEVSKPESAVNLSTKQTTKELGRDRIGRSARFLPFPLLLVTLITTVNALYGPSTSVLQLNPSNFKSKILNSNGLVLVEYFAPWYGQCEALTPMYEKVASVLKGVVAALDVDAHRSLVQEYGIKGFPPIQRFYMKLVGAPEVTFLHWEWLSKQSLVFAELLETSYATNKNLSSAVSDNETRPTMLEKNNLPGAIFTIFCGGVDIGKTIAIDTSTSKLLHSVKSKQTELFLLKQKSEGCIPSLSDKCLVWKVGVSLMERNAVYCQQHLQYAC